MLHSRGGFAARVRWQHVSQFVPLGVQISPSFGNLRRNDGNLVHDLRARNRSKRTHPSSWDCSSSKRTRERPRSLRICKPMP